MHCVCNSRIEVGPRDDSALSLLPCGLDLHALPEEGNIFGLESAYFVCRPLEAGKSAELVTVGITPPHVLSFSPRASHYEVWWDPPK